MESNSNVNDKSSAKLLPNKKRKAQDNDDAVGVATKNKKKHALTCATDGCKNKAYKVGGNCHKHGGKQLCSTDGCTNIAVNGGVCIKHGASWTKRTCSHEGCTNHVVNSGVCIKHGAKVKTCSHKGCNNHAKKGGVCRRHGAYKV